MKASQNWKTKLGSVSEKASGLHSKAHLVPAVEWSPLVRDQTSFVHRVASSRVSSWEKVENNLPEALDGGEITVNDSLLNPLQRLDGPLNQILAAGQQDLQPDSIGNCARRLNQAAYKIKNQSAKWK